jgi:phage gp29-like protein
MSTLDRLAGMLGFVRMTPSGGPVESPAGPVPETGDMRLFPYPPNTLAPQNLTFAAARAILEEHEQGRFGLSAALARTVLRDPDLAAALNRRLLALVGSPHCIEAATTTGAGERYARDLAVRFRTMVPRAAELDMARDAILLGASLGQLVWWFHEATGEIVPVLDPWPMDYAEHEEYEDAWYVVAKSGRIRITPGDGRWVLYTPWSPRNPYYYGAIRQAAEWFLRASNASRDYGRFIELSGQGIIKAYVPSGSRKSPEYNSFIGSLRNLGRNAVAPLPRGKEPHESYDLEIEALSADLHKVFVEMLRVASGKLRLCILGEDLSSQNQKVGTNASSETGLKVSRALVAADAETWAECLRAQVLTPWANYKGRVELAPFAYYDLEDDADKKAEAEAANTAADALTKWASLVAAAKVDRVVDVVGAAERWGVPLLEAPPAEPARSRAPARRLVLRAPAWEGWRRAA